MPGNLTAGVDLGGTKIQTVVLAGHRVVGTSRVLTPQEGAAPVLDAVAGSVRAALHNAQAPPADLAAVGIGTPGGVDAAAGTVANSPNLPGFQGCPIAMAGEVSNRLDGTRVVLDNDVRAAILGEHRRGAGRPFRNLLGVFVGTGVGGGLILEGRRREGLGSAGEIGHTVVRDGGRRCGCGKRGCLEAYAGRARMEEKARDWMADGRRTKLFQIMAKQGRDRVTSGVIARALARHDEVTQVLIDEAVWALGIACANAQNLLDLEAIIIGGGLGDRLGKPFVDRIAEAAAPHLHVPDRPPQFLPTELGDLAGAVGAAVIAGG